MQLWAKLISRAYDIDPYLADILKFINGVGANLIPHNRHGYEIKPIYSERCFTIATYNATKELLIPYLADLKKLLKDLRDDTDREGLF